MLNKTLVSVLALSVSVIACSGTDQTSLFPYVPEEQVPAQDSGAPVATVESPSTPDAAPLPPVAVDSGIVTDTDSGQKVVPAQDAGPQVKTCSFSFESFTLDGGQSPMGVVLTYERLQDSSRTLTLEGSDPVTGDLTSGMYVGSVCVKGADCGFGFELKASSCSNGELVLQFVHNGAPQVSSVTKTGDCSCN